MSKRERIVLAVAFILAIFLGVAIGMRGQSYGASGIVCGVVR